MLKNPISFRYVIIKNKKKSISFIFSIFAKFQIFDLLITNINNENKILNILFYFILFYFILFFEIVKIY